MNIQAGQKVKLVNNLPDGWFDAPTPILTGTIEKVFKNGKFSAAIDQLKNRSADGKKSMHFSKGDLIETGAINQ